MNNLHRSSSLSEVFDEARTYGSFLDAPVDPALLRQIYEHMKWGPTSMNCQPLRIQWVVSEPARSQLSECVYEGNRAKVLSAPVCAVLGMDLAFAPTLAKLFPHRKDAPAYYDGKPALVESTAFRNSSLQAAYLMMAARMVGLDCGPMSGFDHEKVNQLCWTGTSVKTNFLCNMGHGDHSASFQRNPRWSFEEVCEIR